MEIACHEVCWSCVEVDRVSEAQEVDVDGNWWWEVWVANEGWLDGAEKLHIWTMSRPHLNLPTSLYHVAVHFY